MKSFIKSCVLLFILFCATAQAQVLNIGDNSAKKILPQVGTKKIISTNQKKELNKVESNSDNAITYFYKIYPNPSSEKVNLKVPSTMNILKVEFYTILGQKVELVYQINSNIATVDVHYLLPGCYITRVYQSLGVYTLPLIVRH